MNNMNGRHHTFDSGMAIAYGVEESILIQHFQHWIAYNKTQGRNFHEGRTWMYQSRKQMMGYLIYWNHDKIKYLCEKLVSLGILITDNFNRNPLNRTLWYAFANEEAFGINSENKKKFTKEESAQSEIFFENVSENHVDSYDLKESLRKGKSAHRLGKSAQCYNDKDSKEEDTKEEEEGGVSTSSYPLRTSISSKKKIQEPKQEVAPRVMLDPAQQESLLNKLGGSHELRKKCYEKLSDWKIGKNKTECKSDYLSICNWVIDAVKDNSLTSTSGSSNSVESDRILIKKVYKKIGAHKEIMYTTDYIEFFNGVNAVPSHLKVGSKEFRFNVLNELRKRRLDVEGL